MIIKHISCQLVEYIQNRKLIFCITYLSNGISNSNNIYKTYETQKVSDRKHTVNVTIYRHIHELATVLIC